MPNPLLAPENRVEPERRWLDIAGTDVSLLLIELRDGDRVVTLQEQIEKMADTGLSVFRNTYGVPDLSPKTIGWYLWLHAGCAGIYRRLDGKDAEATADTPTTADPQTPGRELAQADFPMEEIVAAGKIHKDQIMLGGIRVMGMTFGALTLAEKKADSTDPKPTTDASSS